MGHTAFGVVANAATLADKVQLSALGLLTVVLLALLGRRTGAGSSTRTAAEKSTR